MSILEKLGLKNTSKDKLAESTPEKSQENSHDNGGCCGGCGGTQEKAS